MSTENISASIKEFVLVPVEALVLFCSSTGPQGFLLFRQVQDLLTVVPVYDDPLH